MTGRAYLEATESLSVHTRATELTMTGDVDFQSAEDVSVSAAGLVGRAAQSIGVSAGEDVVMNVGDDVEIGVGASLSAGFAGGTKTVTGMVFRTVRNRVAPMNHAIPMGMASMTLQIPIAMVMG